MRYVGPGSQANYLVAYWSDGNEKRFIKFGSLESLKRIMREDEGLDNAALNLFLAGDLYTNQETGVTFAMAAARGKYFPAFW